MVQLDRQTKRALEPQFIVEEPRRALVIHGHFYQPPREDPFTGVVMRELQAAPYPNWNARILAECYRPNAQLGNFERISFNVGPTLFRWMEKHDPVTYRRIIEQDRSNVKRFGVGNAMAQAYNHTILPLSTTRDKETQIRWGIADFVHRFGRQPQGMWLPETAVDIETLEILADHHISFTILAPWQADDTELDPTEPYRVRLPSGRTIVVFFYHQALSAGVSFNQETTANAHDFAFNNLAHHYHPGKIQRREPQILMVATDGELYGHHQPFRDWFLAYLVNGAGARAGIRLTFPALWIQQYPPRWETRIRERTSWSCHHGVDRWQRDCDCTPGDGRWKSSLRRAFDNLASRLDAGFESVLRLRGVDPWALRNEYIHVILGDASIEDILPAAMVTPAGSMKPGDQRRIALLLEAQRFRQQMYTSCGWFFDDFARIEARNNLGCAARAIYLTWQATGVDLSDQLAEDLKRVVSNQTGERGDAVFQHIWARALATTAEG